LSRQKIHQNRRQSKGKIFKKFTDRIGIKAIFLKRERIRKRGRERFAKGFHTVKRGDRFFPSPTLFPPRESLVIDIPAGDGKIINLFFRCTYRTGERTV
jgi:hypothetical protein